jgi:hypothetical protein
MHDALDLVIGHACTDSKAGDGEAEGGGGGEGRWGKSQFYNLDTRDILSI